MLQLISLLMLIYSFFLIQISIPKLPPRIPTHFNAAGVADGWGGPNNLWALLGAQALVCVVFLVVPYIGQRFPSTVHIGARRLSDFPPAQRSRMLQMLTDMGACLSIVVNAFFCYALHEVIQAAAQPIPHFDPRWPLGLLVGSALSIILYYLVRFRRAAQDEGNSPGDLTP